MSTKEPLNLKTFSEETAKSLNQEAEQYFDYKREPWTPKDRPLSLFYYIDAPAGVCGGGAVCVVWCDSEKELLEVLANYILITNPGPKPDFDDFQDVFNKISISVSQYWDDKFAKDSAIRIINHFSAGLFQIQWWGNREALLFGDEKFPKILRSKWRDQKNDGDTSPLKPDEVEGFLQYLECAYMI